ncbi:MAG: zinc ABC transporter substrate-binding protein [Bacilli bacterium]|nr:zinc ABC transporter substrate-binding protein [Bacilli bacterium]
MKKIISLLGLVIGIFFLTGCSDDSMDNITIYTSVYPIEYVTEEIYGTHSKVYNMYPQGIVPYDYKLTNKQISTFADSDLIVYNGLSEEKDYMSKMLDINKKLKIIDATNNIEYSHGFDEVWINPSDILMIAQNVKDGLKEYVSSTLISEDIDQSYEQLKINISNLDAEIKEMVENSDNKNIIVQDNELTFLNKYGLNIISLDKDTITEKVYNDAKDMVNGNGLSYIFVIKDHKKNEYTNRLLEEIPDLKVIEIDPINNISTSDKNEGIDYITIMNDNIDKLKQELY